MLEKKTNSLGFDKEREQVGDYLVIGWGKDFDNNGDVYSNVMDLGSLTPENLSLASSAVSKT